MIAEMRVSLLSFVGVCHHVVLWRESESGSEAICDISSGDRD